MLFDATTDAPHQAAILAACTYLPEHVKLALVGTMYTHGEGNDYDYVVFVPSVDDAFEEGTFAQSSLEGYDDATFTTYRSGDINIILTDKAEFFNNFRRAAEVTKYVQGLILGGLSFLDGGLNKEQRIKIHRIIMNGERLA